MIKPQVKLPTTVEHLNITVRQAAQIKVVNFIERKAVAR